MRAKHQDGRPLAIRPAVSEGFVVTTRRTRNDVKADIPSVDDPISKIKHMGKETVKKLQDLRLAAVQVGPGKQGGGGAGRVGVEGWGVGCCAFWMVDVACFLLCLRGRACVWRLCWFRGRVQLLPAQVELFPWPRLPLCHHSHRTPSAPLITTPSTPSNRRGGGGAGGCGGYGCRHSPQGS